MTPPTEGGNAHDPRCDCYMCSRPKARTKPPPLLRRGGLDRDRVWLITRYKARPDVGHGHIIEALTKVDITDEYNALVAEDGHHPTEVDR